MLASLLTSSLTFLRERLLNVSLDWEIFTIYTSVPSIQTPFWILHNFWPWFLSLQLWLLHVSRENCLRCRRTAVGQQGSLVVMFVWASFEFRNRNLNLWLIVAAPRPAQAPGTQAGNQPAIQSSDKPSWLGNNYYVTVIIWKRKSVLHFNVSWKEFHHYFLYVRMTINHLHAWLSRSLHVWSTLFLRSQILSLQ